MIDWPVALGALLVVALPLALVAFRQRADLGRLSATLETMAKTSDVGLELPAMTTESGRRARTSIDALLVPLRRLRESSGREFGQMHQAVGDLRNAAGRMQEVLNTHSSALQQTQVTAEELGRTSMTAAERAQGVLASTNQAETVASEGERDLDASVEGLDAVQSQADILGERIVSLLERTRQIGAIVETVRNLADQSNMLALNAAVEAVRAGEHGKGFAVVAREVRSLADRSKAAARQVGELVAEVDTAIADAAAMSTDAREHVVSGLDQVRGSAEKLRVLTALVRESAGGARQIAAAVSQQDEGIRQLFDAVRDQARMMDVSLEAVEQTASATRTLENVMTRIAELNARRPARPKAG